ncbi:Uncharacterised protein [Amycolatopsis camponoti]|uniref:DUF6351 domain-containing protein n=1 Tax=Amycolatopsis camponoti TaxID=2606593 RepID=A0A6I8M4Q9_9PSEU|nr:DUF6351 family protein [Amycolatopsis camponoti]VVJ22613.1 Uncharacterised protein [Amycolatopsis camponoti]
MQPAHSRTWSAAVGLASVALLAAAVPATASAHDGPGVTITTVSNSRPDLVSGPDVLVRITAPGSVVLRADGHPVEGLTRQADGSFLGLVRGLRPGVHHLVAESGRRQAAVTVIDHAASGPVFSGPQQQPFYCETTAFGLAPAAGPSCAASTVVSYQYRTTGGAFRALTDPDDRPADLATAKVDGHAAPYVVRIETGTIDRAVYQTAALYDGHEPSPLRPDTSWNRSLVYSFGGGCNGGHHQGSSTGDVLDDLFLSQGYAVASSSLNVLENNCSTIISAEAAMMVKEHFITTYGPVAHTIGWGGSGGSIQQYDIADAYPGILDGIIPGFSFPDPFTVLDVAGDCRLLNRYFAKPGVAFTAPERQAVAGFLDYDSCTSWDNSYASRLTAAGSCNHGIATDDNTAIPASAIYDPVTNPGGVKCSVAEQYANQFGRDPKTGFVRGLADNTGVQYGLTALEQGRISPAQFTALNAGIGGYDAAGTPVAERSKADPRAVHAAYRDDIVPSGGNGLRTTPIIDQRVHIDTAGPLLDIHTSEWSFVMRARLEKANHTAANQVIIENQYTPDQLAAANAYELAAMDRWLTAIEADHSPHNRQAKVIANKPPDLTDGCYLSAAERLGQPLTYPATGRCGTVYPTGANPRLQAGGPLTEDVAACARKPLDFGDYPVSFTRTERAELRAAFPSGVCDYGKPGIGPHGTAGTWLGYDSRPGEK